MTLAAQGDEVLEDIVRTTRRISHAIDVMGNKFPRGTTQTAGKPIALHRSVPNTINHSRESLSPPLFSTRFAGRTSTVVQAGRRRTFTAIHTETGRLPRIQKVAPFSFCFQILCVLSIVTRLASFSPSKWRTLAATDAKTCLDIAFAPCLDRFCSFLRCFRHKVIIPESMRFEHEQL